MTRTGLFGGSFNPVHNGHIALAQWLVDSGRFDEVWLMLSPENPLKANRPGATDSDRREMLRLACTGHPKLHPCFEEFELPRPSYTIDTLHHLTAKYPDRKFSIIIGADNWQIFSQWRRPDEIIADFGVTVYPRPGYQAPAEMPEGVEFAADAPQTDISSSRIRTAMTDCYPMLPGQVAEYIKTRKLYE